MSMDGEGKSSSSSNNEDFLVLRKTVRSSLDTVTVPAVVVAITPVSIYKSATTPLIDGTGTASSPVIDCITVSSITSGKMEETSSAGAAASHLAGSHPKVSVSLASIPAISVQDQIGATTTIVSGPAVFDNNDLCAKDLSDQGTFFIYFNCTFLNSFNNILDVCMNSPLPPNQLELQGPLEQLVESFEAEHMAILLTRLTLLSKRTPSFQSLERSICILLQRCLNGTWKQ